MRNKNILKVLSLLAAVCITAGCNGSAAPVQDTVTESLTDDVNYADNSEQSLFQKKFEITDWTMEDLVTDMTICGKKVVLPCTISELSKELLDSYIEKIVVYNEKQIEIFWKE